MAYKLFGSNNAERAPLDELQLSRVRTIGSAIANVDQAMINTMPEVYAAENQGITPVAVAPSAEYPAQSDNRVVPFSLSSAGVQQAPEQNFLQEEDPNTNWLEDAA